MDSLGWDGSPVISHTQSSMWSHHQQDQIAEIFMASSNTIYSSHGGGGKMVFPEEIFTPIHPLQTSNGNSNSAINAIQIAANDMGNYTDNLRTSQHRATTKRRNENCCQFDLVQSDSSTTEVGFQIIQESTNPPNPKKPRSEKLPNSSNISFQQPNSSLAAGEPDSEAIAQMKEMIYRAAVFRPVNLGVEVMEKPKRKNVKISSDPQTVAARQRRERISERIRVLQRLVPGGSKMDTASMLDEAANYLKFLRSQVKALETIGPKLELVNSLTPNTLFPLSSPINHSFSHAN